LKVSAKDKIAVQCFEIFGGANAPNAPPPVALLATVFPCIFSFETFFHLMQLLQTLLSKSSKQVSQTQIAPRANGRLIK